MKLPLFGKKKSLDKVSEGELKLLLAELEFQESSLEREISELNTAVKKQLSICKNILTENEMELLSCELENLVSLKEDAIHRKTAIQNKRHAVVRLLHVKQEMQSYKTSVLDVIDIDSIISHQEAMHEQKDIESMRVEQILENTRTYGKHTKILNLIRAVNADSYSLNDAEREIERLTLQQI